MSIICYIFYLVYISLDILCLVHSITLVVLVRQLSHILLNCIICTVCLQIIVQYPYNNHHFSTCIHTTITYLWLPWLAPRHPSGFKHRFIATRSVHPPTSSPDTSALVPPYGHFSKRRLNRSFARNTSNRRTSSSMACSLAQKNKQDY